MSVSAAAFDIDTDPDTLFDLFGPDYESFAE